MSTKFQNRVFAHTPLLRFSGLWINLFSFLMLLTTISVHAQVEYPPDYLDASPKMFYENKGQIIDNMNNVRNDVKYYTTALSPNVYLFDDGKMSLVQVHGGNDTIPDTLSRIDFQLVGEAFQNAEVNALNKSTDYRNYYLPHCPNGATFCYAYEKFNYREVYPNIDFEVRANQQWGKYYFIVHPGGNPSDIEFEFTGQDSANIDPYWLELYYHTDILELPNAIAYELNSNGTMSPLTWSPAFLNLGNGKIGFQTGSYNTNKVLVIQLAPPMGPNGPTGGNDNLEWSTFYGGNNYEELFGTTVTSNLNMTMVGETYSSNFPATLGQLISFGNTDGVVVQFNSDLILNWATYIGGNDNETLYDIIDVNNDVVVCGISASDNYPTFKGSNVFFDDTNDCTPGTNGYCFHFDAIISKFSTNGSLSYSTYFGLLDGNERIFGLTKDNNNNIIVCGLGTEIPIIGNNATNNGGGFVAKFSSNFNLLFSTQYGAANTTTSVNDVAVDNVGNIFITGTAANSSSFPSITPITSSYTQTYGGGNFDAFVAKYNTSNLLVWSSYYGGSGDEFSNAITIDKSNNVYIGGRTMSSNFPTLPNSGFFDGLSSDDDGFLVKFNNNGVRNWATYFNNSGKCEILDMTTDDNNNLYITGEVQGHLNLLPNSNFYQQNSLMGISDGFVSMFNSSSQLTWSTYFGGNGPDYINALVLAGSKLHIVGITGSNATTFPLEDFGNGAYFQNVPILSPIGDGLAARFSMPSITTSTNFINKNTISIIYPNPTKDKIYFKDENQHFDQVTIIDAVGRVIISINDFNTSQAISVQNLTSGIYNLRLTNSNGIFYLKFMIN